MIVIIFFRQFKIMDDDRSHTISFEEFKKGCHDFGLRQLTDEVNILPLKICFGGNHCLASVGCGI